MNRQYKKYYETKHTDAIWVLCHCYFQRRFVLSELAESSTKLTPMSVSSVEWERRVPLSTPPHGISVYVVSLPLSKFTRQYKKCYERSSSFAAYVMSNVCPWGRGHPLVVNHHNTGDIPQLHSSPSSSLLCPCTPSLLVLLSLSSLILSFSTSLLLLLLSLLTILKC